MGAAYLSREAQSLLKGLLCRDAAKRLGSGPTGAAEVQAHAFFRPIHWPRLMQNQVLEVPHMSVINMLSGADMLHVCKPLICHLRQCIMQCG